jgi:UDP-N-acetylglucosamine diphosphorylase / glucose-1-phosphate thymidylyltransferase / UDP-N-acetylgalactosamine diphosphorylase / glucosamine-1-phosphate N-acetyltransferase / galactosamine-1-phosphate N-acetyltransferase
MPIYRYIFEDTRHVPPFNEPASLLTVGTVPLKLHQEALVTAYFRQDLVLGNSFPYTERARLQTVTGQSVVYSDNLWFDAEFLEYFMTRARKSGQACRAAFPADDPCFRAYTLPLATNFERSIDSAGRPIFLVDLWYFPNGYTDDISPIVVPSGAAEMGFYSVPDFMTMEQGSLTHYAPARAVVSIESWVHVYFAAIICSNFGRGSRFDQYVRTHNFYSLKLLWKAVIEQRQLLSSSDVVRVGKNTTIHPTAVITGPASIGSNCTIGPGVFLDNVTIGDNVTIDDGCQLMMSTLGNNCFLPFRAALYLTAVMENTIIAQNTCLQMCVIGRNSFVGAGSTFTDFNLVEQKPIRAANINGELVDVGQVVLGSAVGHNCRIGSGMVMFPGRMIESDVVLFASPQRRVISRNITFEESDHHLLPGSTAHVRHYPRPNEGVSEQESWESW